MKNKMTVKQIADKWAKLATKYPSDKLTFLDAGITTLEMFGVKNADDQTDDYGQYVIHTNITVDNDTGKYREMTEKDFE